MTDFIPFSRPSLDEQDIDAIREVLRSGWITTGPKNQELEAEFSRLTGTKHAIAVSSATGGMHITLMAANIGPGDEVITPSLTWVSTANMISLVGATPVMVDIDPDTLMVTAAAIEAAITPQTRAIIPVHYAGAPVDSDAIYEVARRHDLLVIEDAAHATGCYYKGHHTGHHATAIFSFHAIKNVTCAEGGMVVTDDDELAARIRTLKFHGLGVDAFDRETLGRKPQAEVITPGFKYNLTDIQAAIALNQLSKLSAINNRRAEIAACYREAFSDAPVLPLALPAWPHQHAWHLFVLRVDEARCGVTRDQFMQQLKDRNIGTGMHFRAVHTQKYYREKFPDLHLPATEWNSDRICSIPLFPDMTDGDCHRVITAIKEITGM